MKFGNLIANLYDILAMIIGFDSLASRNMTYLTFTVKVNNLKGQRYDILNGEIC